jgi:hypothetical protein
VEPRFWGGAVAIGLHVDPIDVAGRRVGDRLRNLGDLAVEELFDRPEAAERARDLECHQWVPADPASAMIRSLAKRS